MPEEGSGVPLLLLAEGCRSFERFPLNSRTNDARAATQKHCRDRASSEPNTLSDFRFLQAKAAPRFRRFSIPKPIPVANHLPIRINVTHASPPRSAATPID